MNFSSISSRVELYQLHVISYSAYFFLTNSSSLPISSFVSTIVIQCVPLSFSSLSKIELISGHACDYILKETVGKQLEKVDLRMGVYCVVS